MRVSRIYEDIPGCVGIQGCRVIQGHIGADHRQCNVGFMV